jgi:hypothetical protein
VENDGSKISRHIVEIPGAEHFGALNSIAGDLYEVQELITCCRATGPNFGVSTSVVVQACWSAAVTRYARCFLSGRGRRIRALDILDKYAEPADRSFHDYLMTLRNYFFAHEGGLEQDHRIVAEVANGELIGIRTAGSSVTSLGTNIAELTFNHVERVARWFNKEAEVTRQVLLDRIRKDPRSLKVLGPYVQKVFDLSPGDPKIRRLLEGG